MTLGDYKGLEAEVDLRKVTDEMIDARIDEDRQKASRTIDVDDRPVEDGDRVNLVHPRLRGADDRHGDRRGEGSERQIP